MWVEGVRPSALHIFLPLQGRGGGLLKIQILHVFYMPFHVILTFPTINGSQECRFYMFFTSAGRGGGGGLENFDFTHFIAFTCGGGVADFQPQSHVFGPRITFNIAIRCYHKVGPTHILDIVIFNSVRCWRSCPYWDTYQ